MEGGLKDTLLASTEREEENTSLREKLRSENKKLWNVAGPAIFFRFSTFGVTVIGQAFIGRFGTTELAAFSLVSTVLLRFAIGVLLGMASALETLCGQAYGARQNHMLGIYLQRSWIVLLMCTVLLVPVFVFTSPILLLLGQTEAVAAAAGTFSLWYIPSVFSYVFSFTLQMYLQAQSKNSIISYLTVAALSLHAFLSWLMAMKLNMGVSGVMYSVLLAYWLPVLGQLVYVFCGWCPDTWKGFSLLAFKDLCPVINLSLSSGAMVCLELWYNTVLVLLTGYMKNAEVELDALSICLTISGCLQMISLGFMGGVSVRVSNELGRGSAKAAKFSFIVIAVISFSIGFVFFVAFLIFRGLISYVFTESATVSEMVAQLSPLLAFTILLNSVQPVLSGVAIGAGWQSVVAYVNLACYYVVGIPIGAALGYLTGLEVTGVWIGMLLGTVVQTLVLVYLTWKTDWDEQVEIARQRVNKWFVPESDSNGQSHGPEH